MADQNGLAIKNKRQNLALNLTHLFSPTFILPFGKGRRWGSNWGGIADAILGGWQFSTIGTIRSGAPFGAVCG